MSKKSDIASKWNQRYSLVDWQKIDSDNPAYVLKHYSHYLPSVGRALDLACGLGANTYALAQVGLEVSAWDISEQAIVKLGKKAESLGLCVDAHCRDITKDPPAENYFDVIVVSHFLERTLFPAIISALRPGGILFYQSFCGNSVNTDGDSTTGPKNPHFRFQKNELRTLTTELYVLEYLEVDEWVAESDPRYSMRGQALLVAKNKSV